VLSVSSVHYNDTFAEKWVRDLSPIEWRGKVGMEFREIELSLLEHAGCWTDADVVDGWYVSLQSGRPIPPPVAVRTERGTYYLHDGNHRYEALQQYLAGRNNAKVRVAVAVPLPGYCFQHRWMGEYGTYVLEPVPQRFGYATTFAVPLVASAAALGLTAALPGVDQSPFFVFHVLSVLLSSWLAGWKAGLLATMFNLIGAAYFLLAPRGSLLIDSSTHALQFLLAAAAMTAVAVFVRQVRNRAEARLTPPILPIKTSATEGAARSPRAA
jgi:hypothetical protein